MVLFCFPLGSSHFNVSSVVAPAHGATVLHNPIQTVEDTLTGCQVLAEMREKKKKISEKGTRAKKEVKLLKRKSPGTAPTKDVHDKNELLNNRTPGHSQSEIAENIFLT